MRAGTAPACPRRSACRIPAMPKKQNLCRVGHSFSYELDMKLQIDNFDGRGPSDYTSAIDASRAPRVVRRLNKPDELQLSLIADRPDFIVPSNGARITLGRSNGEDVFTGYLTQAPAFEYLGWGENAGRFIATTWSHRAMWYCSIVSKFLTLPLLLTGA